MKQETSTFDSRQKTVTMLAQKTPGSEQQPVTAKKIKQEEPAAKTLHQDPQTPTQEPKLLQTPTHKGNGQVEPPGTPKTPENDFDSTPKANPKTPSSALRAIKLEDTPTSQISASNSPSTRMSGPRAPRPSKRHLVRWNDDLDIRLLLTVQSECNVQGINLPWDAIARTLNIGTTGGAVVQHLAKLRIRRVDAGLAVPPALRRGGGGTNRVASSSAGPLSSTRIVTPKVISKRTVRKSSKARKTNISDSDGDETDDGDWKSDEDATYMRARSKRASKRSAGKGPSRKINEETSDEEIDKDLSPTKAGEKRKRSDVKASKTKGVETTSPTSRGRKHPMKVESNAGGDSDDSDHGSSGADMVAAGAPFLALEDDHDVRATIEKKPSLIAKFPYRGNFTMDRLQDIGIVNEENTSAANVPDNDVASSVADTEDHASATEEGTKYEDEMHPTEMKNEQDDSSLLSYAHNTSTNIQPTSTQPATGSKQTKPACNTMSSDFQYFETEDASTFQPFQPYGAANSKFPSGSSSTPNLDSQFDFLDRSHHNQGFGGDFRVNNLPHTNTDFMGGMNGKSGQSVNQSQTSNTFMSDFDSNHSHNGYGNGNGQQNFFGQNQFQPSMFNNGPVESNGSNFGSNAFDVTDADAAAVSAGAFGGDGMNINPNKIGYHQDWPSDLGNDDQYGSSGYNNNTGQYDSFGFGSTKGLPLAEPQHSHTVKQAVRPSISTNISTDPSAPSTTLPTPGGPSLFEETDLMSLDEDWAKWFNE